MRILKCGLLMLCLLAFPVMALEDTIDTIEQGEDGASGATLSQGLYASVDIWGLHLVTIRSYYRHFSPRERAENTIKRVTTIPVANSYNIEFTPVSEGSYQGGWILVDDMRVIGLLDTDTPSGMSLEAYSELVMHRLSEWLERRDAQQKPKVLLFGTLYAGIATLVFAASIFFLLRGREWLLQRLELANNPKHGVSILQVGNLYLMPYLRMLVSGVVRLCVFLVIALVSYIWLAFVMRQFPYTIGYGHRLTDYIVGLVSDIGLSILHSIPNLIMVAIIFWLAKMTSNIVRSIFQRIEQGRLRSHLFDAETAKATRRVIVVLVWLFAVVVAYPYIPGSDTEAFKGVSVFLGLIVSLGSAGIVSQLLGGLIVVYSRAFQPGEFVRIGDYEGTVTTVGVLSTKVKTIRKEEITIPNAVLLNATSTNYTRLSKPDGIIISTSITIGYDTPWPQVHHLLISAAEKTEQVRNEPEPQVRQIALNDWYVEYRLLVHIDDPESQIIVLSELHQNIQNEFADAGLQIMSPHYIDQPEQLVIPAPWQGAIKPDSGGSENNDNPKA